MDSRFPTICLVLVLVLFAALAGCTSNPAQQDATTPVSTRPVFTEKAVPAVTDTTVHPIPSTLNIADQLAAVKSDSTAWREAYRMFLNMKSTEYVHPPYTIDDAAGIYKFDCLGFVDHVLMNADPAATQRSDRVLTRRSNPMHVTSTDSIQKHRMQPGGPGWHIPLT